MREYGQPGPAAEPGWTDGDPTPSVVVHGRPGGHRIALTFDSNMTDAMLRRLDAHQVDSYANTAVVDELEARHVPATFFLSGKWVERYPGLTRRIAADQGAHLIEDSLDLDTCEGAGTVGLELLTRGAPLDTLVIALGGGALASGVGCVAKSIASHVEVIAVQPAGAPAMALSWRSGAVVETETIDTIADGVAGRYPIPEVLDDLLVLVDDVMLVGEGAIMTGMRLLLQHAGLVVEPSAALGVAAVLENRERFAGRRVATILCGSNVTTDDFSRWALGNR